MNRVPEIPVGPLAVRVWSAWKALERDSQGRAPSWRRLEREHGLSEATFSSVVAGRRKSIETETAERMARALGVSLGWLLRGEGDGPAIADPTVERPSAAKLDAAVDGAARSLRRLGFSEEAVGRAVWAILGGAVDDSPLRGKRSPLSGHTQKATVIETPMGRMSVQDLLVAILQ